MPRRTPKVNRSEPTNVGDATPGFRSDLGERLRWLLNLFESRSEAGAIANVTPEHLPSYISGRTKPRFEAIVRLAAAKNVSLDWLATGRGERNNDDAEPEGFVAIPLQPDADARIDAGAEATLLFARAWLATLVEAPQTGLRIVIQRGNANEPAVKDGDALLVDTAVDRIAKAASDEDALYVFVRDGHHVARFVETFVDGRVVLKARNPAFAPQTLSPEEAAKLQIFGRVRWRGGAI
ncbi:MAG TPA: LexA family transcriptional regulator [Rhizomicrobium sp.]|nr:LexA family transcriptional regulator [Rhizomicrobium sp.]